MITLLLAASLAFHAGDGASRCDRHAPQPLGFHSRGFSYVAEVFPPKSRHNNTDHPIAILFEVAPQGADWRVEARRLWAAELPHRLMPQAAIVSMSGYVVTLDDHHQAGADHALVILDQAGLVVRSYGLEELLEPVDLAMVTLSDCGHLWRDSARFFFKSEPDHPRLYVLLHWGRALEVSLTDGALKRGTVSAFPVLTAILASTHPNEEVEVWPLNLRFSSLSDLINRD